MTGFDLYVIIICFIAFFSTLGVLSAMLFLIVRQDILMIEHGVSDDKIIMEYLKNADKKQNPRAKMVSRAAFFLITVVALGIFGWTLSIRFADPLVTGSTSVPRVVLSGSMSFKHESNTYLVEKGLDDQFETFDLIFTRELPGEFELELYDVIVYEIKGDLIVHRIIGIEEPNEKHPDHRIFELRGDALKYSDSFSVRYSQMKAIYEGERVPYIGSFILFMQSPPGYLCILLIVVGFVVAPLLEKILARKKKARLELLGFIY